MFVLHLVFWALLAISSGQSGIPQYIQNQWVVTDDSQYDDTFGQSLAAQKDIEPENSPEVAGPVEAKDWTLSTTSEPPLVKEQELKEAKESTTWKTFLVVVILLVSVVGSLSVAYYLWVWRGGRIYYRAQKEDCA